MKKNSYVALNIVRDSRKRISFDQQSIMRGSKEQHSQRWDMTIKSYSYSFDTFPIMVYDDIWGHRVLVICRYRRGR